MTDVVILGAGISGLALATFLKEKGFSVLLIEAGPRVGGVISTVKKGGYLLEVGPNSTLAKESFFKLCSILDLEQSMLAPKETAKKRFLARKLDDGSHAIEAAPMGPLQAISSPLLSPKGKIRVLLEPFIKATTSEDQSVEEFITRRLGPEIAQEIVAPILNGVWAADFRQLSARSALPKLWEMEQEHGSLLKGALALRKNRPQPEENIARPKKRAHLASFKNGLEELVEKSRDYLGKHRILLDLPASGVMKSSGGWRVKLEDSSIDPIETKTLVSTLPARETSILLEDLDDSLSEKLRRIPSAPLGLLHLAIACDQVEHPLDGFGFLVPPSLDFALLGAIFSSSLFPGRAPSGYHLLSCFVGGASRPELADVRIAEVRERVITELGSCLGFKSEPEILLETFWEKAIPNYPLEHFKTIDALKTFSVRNPGFYFLSSFVQGISVSDRVAEAQKLAEMLSSELTN